MNYFKKHLLACLSLVLICFSCNNTPQSNVDVEQLQQELKEANTKLEAQNTSAKAKRLGNFQKKYEVFQPFGAFSTKEDLLQLYIPVPVSNESFSVHEMIDVSSPNINALLIRVSDNSDQVLGNDIDDIIIEQQRLTDLKLDIDKLRSDQKLNVIVINSIDAFEIDEVEAVRTCIRNQNDYDATSCVDSIRNEKLIPNSKNGDIIIGG